jgi:hypothetical protein
MAGDSRVRSYAVEASRALPPVTAPTTTPAVSVWGLVGVVVEHHIRLRCKEADRRVVASLLGLRERGRRRQARLALRG